MLKWATHEHPAWREQSNFISYAAAPPDSGVEYEQLWLRRESGESYTVCCLPFFLYDLALGDRISLAPHGGLDLVYHDTISRSGRHVARIWFPKGHERGTLPRSVEELVEATEWWSPRLVALDIATDGRAVELVGRLQEAEARGELQFETGWS